MPFGFAKDEINNTVCGNLHAYLLLFYVKTPQTEHRIICVPVVGGGGSTHVWLALMVCQKLLLDL